MRTFVDVCIVSIGYCFDKEKFKIHEINPYP